MSEIIMIFVVIVAVFCAVIGYSIYRTRQQKKAIMQEMMKRLEPELDDADLFSSVLNNEMAEHTVDTEVSMAEDQDQITLSEQAQQQQTQPQPKQAKQEQSVPTAPQQAELDLTEKSAFDIDEEQVEPEDQQAHVIAPPQEWEMMLALTVMAQPDKQFLGTDLLVALQNEQLEHEQGGLFSRYTTGVQKQILFSVANVLAPGSFHLTNVTQMNTPGILIFAKLPGPLNGLALFDELLESTQRISAALDGIVCDETRQPISDDFIEDTRSRILNHNFSMHSEIKQQHNVYSD